MWEREYIAEEIVLTVLMEHEGGAKLVDDFIRVLFHAVCDLAEFWKLIRQTERSCT